MNYKIKWTQPYTMHPGQELMRQLEALKEELTEQVLNHENFDFPEANEALARIMAK
jgi:hypothetical protein